VPEHFTSGTQRLALVLENESSQPIRVCTACGSAHRSHKWNPKTGVLEVDVLLIPGGWEGDHGPFTTQDIPRSFTTLRPGDSMDLPFNVWPDPNSPVRVKAHYAVQPGYGDWASQPEFQKLDMWRGKIDAGPVTLRIKE
jgi:ribosomal protein L32